MAMTVDLDMSLNQTGELQSNLFSPRPCKLTPSREAFRLPATPPPLESDEQPRLDRTSLHSGPGYKSFQSSKRRRLKPSQTSAGIPSVN